MCVCVCVCVCTDYIYPQRYSLFRHSASRDTGHYYSATALLLSLSTHTHVHVYPAIAWQQPEAVSHRCSMAGVRLKSSWVQTYTGAELDDFIASGQNLTDEVFLYIQVEQPKT